VLDDDEVDELVDELVDDEDDTLPLDDDVEETLPLDVLVLDPPVEVLELEPPLDVEVDPPLDVDETTILPLDPPPPPKNPPAKNPPPNPPPPDPPTMIGAAPPPPLITGCGGNGIGAPCEVTVTTCGWHVVVRVVVTTRLRAWATGRTACLMMCRLIDTRSAACVSATWTAPPPMMAPPQAHAHNFAKAIRTDMIVFPVWTMRRICRSDSFSSPDAEKGRRKP
jgi:hypothetical protein